jgi:hypothetical protein
MTEKSQGTHSHFAKGTLVVTRDGQKPIEEILLGDWVLSLPEEATPLDRKREKHELVYRQVIKATSSPDRAILELAIADLAAGFKEIVGISPPSLVYLCGNGWAPASGLRFGSTLENSASGNLLVTKVKSTARLETAYSIEVDQFHTYYVGRAQAWVHC